MSSEPFGEEAARWVARLRAEDFSEIEGRAFRRWVLESPLHERAFREHQAVFLMTGTVLSDGSAGTQSAPHSAALALPARRKRWAIGLAAAAAFLMVLVGGGVFLRSQTPPAEVYVTGIGETRKVVLAEGSSVQLNTRTRLQWFGAGRDRRVELIEGEAFFDVKSDPVRPFRVRVDGGEIQVLGTQFNVYRKTDGRVVVSVVQGAVNVRPRSDAEFPSKLPQQELRADQQVIFNGTGWTSSVRTVNAGNIVRWREGVLKLEDAPMSEVIEELKRYTSRRIVIADPQLASIGIGGAFSIHDTRAALEFIAEAVPMRVQETKDAFILSYRYEELGRIGSDDADSHSPLE